MGWFMQLNIHKIVYTTSQLAMLKIQDQFIFWNLKVSSVNVLSTNVHGI